MTRSPRPTPTAATSSTAFPARGRRPSAAYELALARGIAADAAVYLALDDDVARRRLAGRAAGGRIDDADAEVIDHRLELFHANMRPILDFFEERGILVTVDASQPVEAVTEAILAALAKIDAR